MELALPAAIKVNIINSLTERYIIEAIKGPIQLGDSVLGGFPHLPVHVDYPQEEDYYYEFVAQINLADLTDNTIEDFPRKGMLYFFIDDDFNVGNIPCKVMLLEDDPATLEIKRPPAGKKSRCESFDGRTEHTVLKLQFSKSLTIPQQLLSDIVNHSMINGNAGATGFDLESFYTRDQVGGYPATWRVENAEWWAYLSKRRFSSLYYLTDDQQMLHLEKEKINFNQWIQEKVDALIQQQRETLAKHTDTSAYIYPYWQRQLEDLLFTKQHLDSFISELDQHKADSKKWKQLLSISSSYEANISFGDGKMEFLVNSDDLKHKKFDNVFCHVYG